MDTIQGGKYSRFPLCMSMSMTAAYSAFGWTSNQNVTPLRSGFPSPSSILSRLIPRFLCVAAAADRRSIEAPRWANTALLRAVPETSTYQSEKDEEAGDISDHATERDLKRPKNLKGRHEVSRASYTEYIGDGKQNVRDNLRIIWLPGKPGCK